MTKKVEQYEVPDGCCVLCRVEIQGHGNNPSPVVQSGKCCDNCNRLIVIPHRIRMTGLTEDMVMAYFERILSEEKEEKITGPWAIPKRNDPLHGYDRERLVQAAKKYDRLKNRERDYKAFSESYKRYSDTSLDK